MSSIVLKIEKEKAVLKLENIETALNWDEGVINVNYSRSGDDTLYIMEDWELEECYKNAIEEKETTLDIDNFSRELCKDALIHIFKDEELVNAGMDWEHPEKFKKMLQKEKAKIEKYLEEIEEWVKESEEDW